MHIWEQVCLLSDCFVTPSSSFRQTRSCYFGESFVGRTPRKTSVSKETRKLHLNAAFKERTVVLARNDSLVQILALQVDIANPLSFRTVRKPSWWFRQVSLSPLLSILLYKPGFRFSSLRFSPLIGHAHLYAYLEQ